MKKINNLSLLSFLISFSRILFIEIKKLELDICIFDIIDFIKNDKCLNDTFNENELEKRIIKLFWHKKIPNAGDYFGKWLLEKLGYIVEFSENPDIVINGSILGLNNIYSKNTVIWGAGYNFEKEQNQKKEERIFYAVRGSLTYTKLKLNTYIALGDPALLLPRFFQPETKKKYEICIASHFRDYYWFFDKYKKKYYIINMGVNDIEKVANEINKCKFVFSSSLYGIIFSHSLGIPAVHIEKNILEKTNFIFKDYYSTLDIPYIKTDLKKKFEEVVKKVIKNKSKYLPSKKKIKQIQDSLLFSFPYQKMENVICAIAKNENKYINEWCHYHLNLGFDHIFIYDNNDNTSDYIGDFIDKSIRNKVYILNINDKKTPQHNSYSSFYYLFNQKFKWCAFIDIDEYIVLEKWNNISQFVNDEIFKNADIIRLRWHIFGDDNLIKRPFKQPLYKEIKKRLVGHKLEIQGKSIVKGNLKNAKFKSAHFPHLNNKVPSEQYLSNGRKTPESNYNIGFFDNNIEPAYINHYMTKTISEFLEQKLNRGDAVHKKRIDLNYFWSINQKTKEKETFIQNFLNK